MEKLIYWIWLSSVISNTKADILLREYKEPENIYNTKFSSHIESFKPLQNKDLTHSEKIFEYCKKNQIHIITKDDERYSKLLKEYKGSPIILYVKGNTNLNLPSIAIVGSRNSTEYGKGIAQKLAYGLAECGIAVVSGLAKGIDAYAHRGALKGAGVTFGALGCGVDVCYPKENKEIFEYIVKNNGSLISEYPPGTKPNPIYFPQRNRIISGISLGTVVIEAGIKSGALITSNYALEQNKLVFAVPGDIDKKSSEGTNNLIKQGAKLVTNIEDILSEFDLLFSDIAYKEVNKKIRSYRKQTQFSKDVEFHKNSLVGESIEISKNSYTKDITKENRIKLPDKTIEYKKEVQKRPEVDISNLSEIEKKILEIIGKNSVHIDEIYRQLDGNIVSSELLIMEMNGYIIQKPGKFFIKAF